MSDLKSQRDQELSLSDSPPSQINVVYVVNMAPTERLDVLRERSKDLLKQLKQLRETLQRPSGLSRTGAEERRDPADCGPAREAVSRPPARPADACDRQMVTVDANPTLSSTSKHNAGSAECKPPSDLRKYSNIHPNRLQEERQANTKSSLVNHNKDKREVRSRVSFQLDEGDDGTSASDRHHLQPLLGYDWIAGILDAEDSLIERSDEFFNDLRTFRSLNKDECVHSPKGELSGNHSSLPLLKDKDSLEDKMDIHQCTFSYRINSRLFPVPLHSQECCPVCKRPKSSYPHTAADPALLRVSIPRSALLPTYKYKAHRRSSFDPSDSMGLPSHCHAGWSNKGQSTRPPPCGLDLRSSLNMKNYAGAQTKDTETLCASEVSANQISDVSCMPRYNFQHFSPKKSLQKAFSPSH